MRSVEVAGHTPMPMAELKYALPADLAGIRILVIMPSVPILGMERANLQIMKMMRERGADVLFITEQTYGSRIQREAENMGCRWAPMSFQKLFHLAKDPREMTSVLYAWGRGAWQIDCIYRKYRPTHIYVTNLPHFVAALLTLLRTNEPVIFRLPNPPDAANVGLAKQRLSDWLWRYCVTKICDVIVCNSEYSLSRLKKVGLKPSKGRLIYNCVPERTDNRASDAPKTNPCRLNIVYLGQLRREKGVKELFDASLQIVRERSDVDFYFAGDYEWRNPFAKGLVTLVKAKNLESRIHFTGEIGDVDGLLAQCHLHACPSLSPRESFPNVVLEAKSHGIPSVAFATSGLPEAITHLVDGYLCHEKCAKALYEGIRYFLDNPSALEAAGRAARQSLARFSRERISNQWAEVFRNA